MDQEVSRRPLAVLDTEDRQRQLSLSIHSQNKTAPISPVLSPSHPGKSETPTTKRVRHDLRSSDPSYSHASSGAFSPIPLYNSPNNRLNPFGGSPQGRPPPSGGPAPRHGRTSKKPSPPRHAPGPRSGSAPGVMRQLFPIECSQQLLPRQAVPLQKTTRGHSHAPTKPSPADALKTESSMAAMRAAYRSNQQHASPIQHASKTPPAKSISPSRRGPVAQVSAPHPAQDSQARRPHPLHPVTTGNALPAKATDTSVRPVTCATSACKTTVSATTRELISSGVSPASKASAPQPQNPDAPLPTAVETRATTAPRDISSSRPLRGFTTEERTTIDVDIMPREDDRETKATVSSPVVVWTTRQFQYNLAHAILSRKAERIAALLHLYARLRVRDGMEAAGDRATPFLPCVVLVEEAGSSSTTAAQSACILDGVIDSHTGYTLMHLAVLTGSMTVVRECLRAGSAVHAVEDVQGDTPLTLAMRAFPGSVTALFAAGKGIEVSRRLEGRERSVYASLARDESMHHVPASVKELQTGCQQNLLHCAVTADGATPAWPGRIPFLKLLVEHYHVNPRQEDAFGMTPALWALEHARFLGPNAREVVQYLRDAAKRADVNDMESTKKWLRTLVSGKEAPPAEPPARIPPPADAKEVNVQRLSGAASPPLRIDRVSPPPAETGATRSYSRGRSPSVRFRTPSPSPPPAAPTGRCRTHTASPSAEGVVVHGNSKEVGKVGSRRVMLARTLSRSPGRCAMVPSPSVSPSVVAMPETSPPQMVLITRHCDWLLYYLRGPITRLACVALLLLLHIVSYSLDCSASWFREVRHGYWFTVINLLGSKWNGSTFFMGFFRVLCILLGSVGGAVVLVVLVGPFGARWLRLPCLGAFLPGEIPFLQSQFGFAYLTHYVPHRRASLWLGVVGAVSGLYFSALLYNALLHAFWSGQADWATIGPSMGSSTTYAGVMLRVWASALLIDWFLACYLLDLMYQQGVLTAYLPHYRYDTLANWIDLHLAPWLSRRVLWRVCTHARFRQKMSSAPPVYVPLTRTDGDAPEKDDDAPRSWISKRLGGVEMTTDLSIHRFRLWVFWVTVLTGMGILVFIFGMASLLSTPSEEVPSMVYLAEPRSPPAARACCAVLFSSLCIALLCIMVLQEWTWPALSTHRFLALPGTTLPFSTGWGLMLLLWIEVTYDYRQLIENARVAHAHGAGALTVAILFTSPVWAASIFTLAMILSTSGYLNRCGVISTTHDSGDGLARHRPWLASAVLMWRTWLAGVHLTSIPAPGVFGLLRTLQPQLPQWAQLDEAAAVVSSTSTDSAAAKSPLAAVDAEEVAVSELLAVLDHHGMLPMVLKASGVVSASANLPCSDSDSLSDNGSIADNAKAPDSTDVDADNMAKLRHVAAHRWRYARRKRFEWRAEVLAGAAGTSRGRRKRYVARRKEKSLVHVILGGSE